MSRIEKASAEMSLMKPVSIDRVPKKVASAVGS